MKCTGKRGAIKTRLFLCCPYNFEIILVPKCILRPMLVKSLVYITVTSSLILYAILTRIRGYNFKHVVYFKINNIITKMRLFPKIFHFPSAPWHAPISGELYRSEHDAPAWHHPQGIPRARGWDGGLVPSTHRQVRLLLRYFHRRLNFVSRKSSNK